MADDRHSELNPIFEQRTIGVGGCLLSQVSHVLLQQVTSLCLLWYVVSLRSRGQIARALPSCLGFSECAVPAAAVPGVGLESSVP